MGDHEYLLALAEEAHIWRAQLHHAREATRRRMARMERRAEICDWLRAEIHRLMYAPFSWQVENKSTLLRTLTGSLHVNGNGTENIQKTAAGYCKWLTRADFSASSRHTIVAGLQGACLSEKLSVRGVVPAFIEPTNPGNVAPIAPWLVTPKGALHAGIADYSEPNKLTPRRSHEEKGKSWAMENQAQVNYYTWDHVR